MARVCQHIKVYYILKTATYTHSVFEEKSDVVFLWWESLFTYTGWLLATPDPISLTDSGDRAYQQVGGVAVEPDL